MSKSRSRLLSAVIPVFLIFSIAHGEERARVLLTVTNNQQDVGNKAWWAVYKPGNRNSYIAHATSGRAVEVPEGTYDIKITFSDGRLKEERWMEKQELKGAPSLSLELGLEIATVKISVTNGGIDTGRKSWWAIYKPGQHGSYIEYAYSGSEMRFPSGLYDIGVHFEDDHAKTVRWLENVQLEGALQKTVELAQPVATAKFTVTNNGADVGKKAWWAVYNIGERNSYVAYEHSGNAMTINAGTYDIGIHFEDDKAKTIKWLEGEKLEGTIEKVVELGQPTATAKYTITNNGVDVGNKAWWGVYAGGQRDSYVGYEYSGKPMTVIAGTYDVGIHFQDDKAKTIKWLEGEKLEGTIEKVVELGQSIAQAKVVVTNGGQDVGKKAWWAVYTPGNHRSYVAYDFSGNEMRVPSGAYDIGIHFEDGDAKTVKWLEHEELGTTYNKTVELDFPIAKVRVSVTNGGAEVPKGSAWWGVYEPGERSSYYAYGHSTETLTIPRGTYDIGVHFDDGAGVKIKKWVTAVEVQGDLERVIELGADIADVTVNVSRKGQPLEHAWCGAYKSREAPNYQAYGYSGKRFTVEEGVWDIGCFNNEKGYVASAWLEKRELKGTVTLNVELDTRPASLTVTSKGKVGKNGPGGDSPGGPPNGGSNISIIFDASGSMAAKSEEKKTRLDVAKEVLSDVIDSLPANTRVALNVYGTAPKSQMACEDMKVLFPLGEVKRDALKEAVFSLEPSGYTPIAYSLGKAAAALPKDGKNSLILITDGIESCNGDPCAVSSKLSREGIVTRSYVVGFGLGLDKGNYLSCIGQYYPAADRAALSDALKKVIQQSIVPISGHVTVSRAGNRDEIIAQGGLDEKLEFASGNYDVVIRRGEQEIVWENRKIEGDVTASLDEKPAAVLRH